jgi:hypothetical protein
MGSKAKHLQTQWEAYVLCPDLPSKSEDKLKIIELLTIFVAADPEAVPNLLH